MRTVVECACSSTEHQIQFELEDYDNYPNLFLAVHLSQSRPWYLRLWSGIQYVLGHRSIYGNFDEIILEREAAQQIIDVCQAYLDRLNGVEKEEEDE
jgi:hypothetical protein